MTGLIACSRKNLLHLNQMGLSHGLFPSDTEKVKIYLVADDKVVMITQQKMHTTNPASEVFFSYNSTPGRFQEIIGLLISGNYSSLFLTISWQQNVGPLSNKKSLPAMDSNGWISIDSLDGILYSMSPNGDIRKFLQRTASNSVIRANPVLNCSGFLMYISQTIMETKSSRTIGSYTYISAMKSSSILFTLLSTGTGTTYWTGKYPGELPIFLVQ